MDLAPQAKIHRMLIIKSRRIYTSILFLVLFLFSMAVGSAHTPSLFFKNTFQYSGLLKSGLYFKYQNISYSENLSSSIFSAAFQKSFQIPNYFSDNLPVILSFFLIIFLLLLTISLYRLNKLKAKAHRLLKKKNKELWKVKEDAEKLAQAKTQALSTISHELRTPLNSFSVLVEFLGGTDLDKDQREHVDNLKFTSEYLKSLVNNILILSKLEANKIVILNIPFNLRKTIDDVITLLSPTAKANNNYIILEYDSSLPDEIMGDSIKFSQILINLISNASHFTENGKIWIRLMEENKTPDKTGIRIEVEDTGDGISREDQKIIFESFSQGSISKKSKQGGTGLGLAIVKGLLEAMGSHIELESTLGNGSKFSFLLHCSYSQSSADFTASEKRTRSGKILTDKSVLLVEDDRVNQMITKKLLETKKIKCLVVDNGEDAIKILDNTDIHLILMDLSLGGMSGIETAKEIRRSNTKIPIIALTASEVDEIKEELQIAGFNDFISKPFRIDELFEKIETALEQNSLPISPPLEKQSSS